jgi:predicted lipoprotein with Yx(FWY)xxD motif
LSSQLRRAGLLACLGIAALLAVGCGGNGSGSTAIAVDTAQLGGLGPVLTTPSGQVLYMFPPDAERHVTCVARCAKVWPPFIATGHGSPRAGSGVQQSLLGTDPNPSGGPPVVTYDGWPLYTYVKDHKPRQANGQARYDAGGYWYVIAPSGQPITVGA